jgi:hypothetical protein
VAASILFVTVKLPKVPTVVMKGWFADVIVALIVAALIVLVVNVPGTVKLPIKPFTTLSDSDVVLPTTVRLVNDPTVVINGWFALVIVALIVLASMLLVTVRLPNVPTVVMSGWFASVIVALMVRASILFVTVKFVKVPTVVMNG